MKINKKSYIFEYSEESNEVILYNADGGRFLKMPVSALFTEGNEEIQTGESTYSFEKNILTVKAQSLSERFGILSFYFQLNEDSIEVAFCAEAKEDVYVEQTELFRNGKKGMYMVDCIKYFTPAPRNNFGVNRAFENVCCDCTMNAYFAPPPLNFCIGNRKSQFAAHKMLKIGDHVVKCCHYLVFMNIINHCFFSFTSVYFF